MRLARHLHKAGCSLVTGEAQVQWPLTGPARDTAGLLTPSWSRRGPGCPLQPQRVTAMVAAPRTRSYLRARMARLLEPTLWEMCGKCVGHFPHMFPHPMPIARVGYYRHCNARGLLNQMPARNRDHVKKHISLASALLGPVEANRRVCRGDKVFVSIECVCETESKGHIYIYIYNNKYIYVYTYKHMHKQIGTQWNV